MVEVVPGTGWVDAGGEYISTVVEVRENGTIEVVIVGRVVHGSGKTVHGHGDGPEK